MKVKVVRPGNRLEASVFDLIADYRHKGLDKQRAWSEFVKDRLLQPEIDARKFYQHWESYRVVDPLIEMVTLEIEPTHYDTLYDCLVQIWVDDYGVYRMTWANGSTGSNPPHLPPESSRFISLEEE